MLRLSPLGSPPYSPTPKHSTSPPEVRGTPFRLPTAVPFLSACPIFFPSNSFFSRTHQFHDLATTSEERAGGTVRPMPQMCRHSRLRCRLRRLHHQSPCLAVCLVPRERHASVFWVDFVFSRGLVTGLNVSEMTQPSFGGDRNALLVWIERKSSISPERKRKELVPR